jgi:hypothetical protein
VLILTDPFKLLTLAENNKFEAAEEEKILTKL